MCFSSVACGYEFATCFNYGFCDYIRNALLRYLQLYAHKTLVLYLFFFLSLCVLFHLQETFFFYFCLNSLWMSNTRFYVFSVFLYFFCCCWCFSICCATQNGQKITSREWVFFSLLFQQTIVILKNFVGIMRGKMIGMEIVVNFQKPNNSNIALKLQTNK